MFGKQLTLFRVLGFAIRVDVSWILIALLVTWTLAEGAFRIEALGPLPAATRWTMGAAGALGLFASIVLHELSHSLVARRYGIEMKGITLFLFGGVSEMTDEPPNARAEFAMAIAGPISSVLVAAAVLGVFLLGRLVGWPPPVLGVLGFLWSINLLLAAFNLVPGFPLDGGRVLRSLLWAWKKNLRWATRVAARVGAGFGAFLIALGVLSVVLWGNFIGGMWWFLIGLFLRSAAGRSYQQLLVREALVDEPVWRLMNPNPVTVPPELPLSELVDHYMLRHHFKMFPVVDADGRLVGCVHIQQVKDVPRADWDRRTVGEMACPCGGGNTIDPDEEATRALARMSRSGQSRLVVARDGKLAGLITLKDIMGFLSIKLQLEEASNHLPPALRGGDIS